VSHVSQGPTGVGGTAASAVSPLVPQLGQAASDPPNARAMHRVAVKAMNDHPDLMADPHWASVRTYVENRHSPS